MREGGFVVAGVELLGEHIEGMRVFAEVFNVEDGLGGGKVEAGEVGVKAGAGGAKVGYCRHIF